MWGTGAEGHPNFFYFLEYPFFTLFYQENFNILVILRNNIDRYRLVGMSKSFESPNIMYQESGKRRS